VCCDADSKKSDRESVLRSTDSNRREPNWTRRSSQERFMLIRMLSLLSDKSIVDMHGDKELLTCFTSACMTVWHGIVESFRQLVSVLVEGKAVRRELFTTIMRWPLET